MSIYFSKLYPKRLELDFLHLKKVLAYKFQDYLSHSKLLKTDKSLSYCL